MDLGISKRCEGCYTVVRFQGGILDVFPYPLYEPIKPCPQEQWDSNTCPECGEQKLMVVY